MLHRCQPSGFSKHSLSPHFLLLRGCVHTADIQEPAKDLVSSKLWNALVLKMMGWCQFQARHLLLSLSAEVLWWPPHIIIFWMQYCQRVVSPSAKYSSGSPAEGNYIKKGGNKRKNPVKQFSQQISQAFAQPNSKHHLVKTSSPPWGRLLHFSVSGSCVCLIRRLDPFLNSILLHSRL